MPPLKARRSTSAGKDPTYIVKPPAMKVRKATHRIATIVGQRPASLISTASRDSREERCDGVAVLIVICAQLHTHSFNRRDTDAPDSFHILHVTSATNRQAAP